MKKGKNQHVVPTETGWAVRGENNTRSTKNTDTRNRAVEIARKIAKNQKSEIVIRGKNGKIKDKDSYGNDPFPQRDKKH